MLTLTAVPGLKDFKFMSSKIRVLYRSIGAFSIYLVLYSVHTKGTL
jgi:hypothetical protein